jgi:hypothetical protein
VTDFENVSVKTIGEMPVVVPEGVTTTVGAIESYVMDAMLEAVQLLPAASLAADALTLHVTVPCPLGVTGRVYVVPLPASVPFVPLLTVTPEAVSPVTGSENVSEKRIGDVLVAVPEGVTTPVGATVSYVTVAMLEAVLSLPEASLAADAMTWHVTAPCPLGVIGRVYVVPLPASAPLVPLLTVISEAARPVTAVEKVNVKRIGEPLVELFDGVTITDG